MHLVVLQCAIFPSKSVLKGLLEKEKDCGIVLHFSEYGTMGFLF